MKEKAKHLIRMISVALILCMLMGIMLVEVSASNSAVQNAANGVMQFNMIYTDDDHNEIAVSYGSCFLINENTIVTCAHCVDLADEWEIMKDIYAPDKTLAQFKERISYAVTITRDVTLPAALVETSNDMDWAVLTLQSSLQNTIPLKIRSSEEIQLTEDVFALGFPALISSAEDTPKYTPDDVTITDGQVNKVSYGENIFSGKNYDFIQTSCKLTSGNSGGPLVDENGYVIGICEGAWGEAFQSDYYTAVAIDQVTDYLNAVGIVYESAAASEAPAPEAEKPAPETEAETEAELEAEPVPEPADTAKLDAAIGKAENLNSKDFTPETYQAVTEKLNSAKQAKSSDDQAKIDAAEKELTEAMDGLKEASNLLMILIIAAAILIVAIVVIVLLVLTSGKKKKAKKAAEKTARAPVPAGAPVSASGFTSSPISVAPSVKPSATTSLEEGATTLLNEGAGETTVLSKKVSGGKLIRKKNGETIEINSEEFTIGRERKRVSYCVSGNTSISRAHAKVVVRNDVSYIVDLGTANGTYVNGVKAASNVEVQLKNGDKVTLADEEFEFQA